MGYPTIERYEPLILGGPLAPDLSVPQHQWDVRRLNEKLVPQGYKWCGKCAQALPLQAFAKAPTQFYGLASGCKVCKSSDDPERRHQSMVKRMYGLNPAEYEALLAKQNGVCAICGGPPTRTPRNPTQLRFRVDHDHDTGAVRGLLCTQCNVGLGSFRDTPALLSSAIAYIEQHK